nr:hypothetical protein [uncultured Chryseobacterium sp.]
MRTLSLIGILVSILGIIISFAVIDNHNDFYTVLREALGITYESEHNRDIYKKAGILDTGTNMCFVLMGLFTLQLFICIKFYRSEEE